MRHILRVIPYSRRLIAIALILCLLCIPSAGLSVRPAHADGLPPDGLIYVNALTDMALLAGPTKNSFLLDVVPSGTTIKLMARNSALTWALTNFNGSIGWVSISLLFSPDESISDLPLPTPEMMVPGAKDQAVATAAVDLGVHTGPGNGFNRIGVLIAGQSVLIDGRFGNWIRFRFGGIEGWTSRSVVWIAGSLSSVPRAS